MGGVGSGKRKVVVDKKVEPKKVVKRKPVTPDVIIGGEIIPTISINELLGALEAATIGDLARISALSQGTKNTNRVLQLQGRIETWGLLRQYLDGNERALE